MIDNSSAQHSETVVSLLVPVYNVEKYVEQCARSIFGQTYPNLEIIFVDDCSPDHSIEIIRRVLEEYPQRKPQTKIIPHTHNQGRAVARQTAMQNCTGYYTIHCDSDDYMAPDAISQLVAKARKEDADRFFFLFENEILPESAAIKPKIILNNVVFPAPAGPIMPYNFPVQKRIDTFLSALVRPKFFEIFSMSITTLFII